MAGFEWTWPTQCNRPLVEELFSLNFIEEPANIVLIGPNGIGKTMIAKNLLHQAILHGHTARFTLASDMLHDGRPGLLHLARAPPASSPSSIDSCTKQNC